MTIRGVIFDLDGTLLASEAHALRFGRLAFARHGLEFPESAFRAVMGMDFQKGRAKLLESLAPDTPYDAIEVDWRALMKAEADQNGIPLRPQADELVQHLAARGIALAVATSSQRARAQERLEQAGLWHFLHALVGREDVAQPKPHPEVYLKAIAALGLQPADCLAFEDSDIGTQAARAAGLRVVQVPDLAAARGDHADLLAPDLMTGARAFGL